MFIADDCHKRPKYSKYVIIRVAAKDLIYNSIQYVLFRKECSTKDMKIIS